VAVFPPVGGVGGGGVGDGGDGVGGDGVGGGVGPLGSSHVSHQLPPHPT